MRVSAGLALDLVPPEPERLHGAGQGQPRLQVRHTFSLGGGEFVRIHTGKGTKTSTDRYWGLSWSVWNNTGDTAYLRNADFVLRDTCEWTSVGSGWKWC
jgi:hypothetical protein